MKLRDLKTGDNMSWMLKLILWAYDIHVPMERLYHENYGKNSSTHRRPSSCFDSTNLCTTITPIITTDTSGHKSSSFELIEPDRRRRIGLTRRRVGLGLAARRPTGVLLEPNWLVDGNFLDFSRLAEAFRRFTIIYLVYIALKYPLVDSMHELLEQSLGLERPIQCYLPGRFLVNESFAYVLAFCLACNQLYWRLCVRALGCVDKLTSIFFLLLSPQELDFFYAKIYSNQQPDEEQAKGAQKLEGASHRSSIALQPSLEFSDEELGRLSGRELFLLETLCFAIKKPGRITYSLRPNRTPECHRKLRKLAARVFLTTTYLAIWQTTIALGYTVFHMAFADSYQRSATKCLMPESAAKNTTTTTSDLRERQDWLYMLTLTFDLLENVILWIEINLVSSSSFFVVFIMQTDLIWYSRMMHTTMLKLYEIARAESDTVGWRYGLIIAEPEFERYKKAVRLLQMQMMDFFSQIRTVDKMVSRIAQIMTFGWLFIAANLVYTTQIKSIHELTKDTIMIVVLILSIFAIDTTGLLLLQRISSRLYVTLCSLMAYDKSGYWQDFGILTEMFTLKKNYYTLFQHHPFTRMTIVKLVGYSATCFFLIVSLFKNPMFFAADCSA